MARSYQSALRDEWRMSDAHVAATQASKNVMYFFENTYKQLAKHGHEGNKPLMDGLRKYHNALKKLYNGIQNLKEDEYNKCMQELGGMQEWLTADAGDGKTNYQLISSEVDRHMQKPQAESSVQNLMSRTKKLLPGWEPGKGAEVLDNSLNAVGKYYDVGLDLVAVQEAQAQSKAKSEPLQDKIDPTFSSYKEYVQYQWDQANREDISDEKRRGHLARIIAANGMYLQLSEEKRSEPPRTDDLEEIAAGVANSEAFKNLMSNGNDKVFAASRDADALTRNLSSAMGMAAPYQVSEAKKKLIREQAGIISQKLQESWEAAIFGNSDEYEKAVNAIGGAVSAPLTGEDLYKAVKTVEDYCDLRYKPRMSTDGQMRFRQCMNFLKAAKPPKEFQAYCDHINLLRGVKPGDKHYIAPELYGAEGRTAEHIMSENLKNLQSGEGSVRDVACIIAASELGSKGDRNAALDPQKLVMETEKVLADPKFKELAASKTLEELTELAAEYPVVAAISGKEQNSEKMKGTGAPNIAFDPEEVQPAKQEIDDFDVQDPEFNPPEAGFGPEL